MRFRLSKTQLSSVILTFSFCSISLTASYDHNSIEIRKASLPHKTWEIKNRRGVTVLPDMFYSDEEQNLQIMPISLNNNNRPQINNVIYPTLGNPSLFIKCTKDTPCSPESKSDELMIVLRLDKSIADSEFQIVKKEQTPPHDLLKKNQKNNNSNDSNDILEDSFYELVERKENSPSYYSFEFISRHNDNIIFDIQPSYIKKLKSKFIPNQLKNRDTYIINFNQSSLRTLSEGLYDIQLKRVSISPINRQTITYKETQFNAVKIFEGEPFDNYKIINVTDTQISMGTDLAFDIKTKLRLNDFVKKVNELYFMQNNQRNISPIAFITFNGDLHNGGSPFTLSPKTVAYTYQNEAKFIYNTLKDLKVPIFLTPGNHDGYASTGVTPSAIEKVTSNKDSINSIFQSLKNQNSLHLSLSNHYLKYLEAIKETPGGYHLDIFGGVYIRDEDPKGHENQSVDNWIEVPEEKRNIMLYDGFNQWRKTYGPLYMAWSFKNNYFVNINSYDLRQHHRTGWGMYTVNYGGGISPFQMSWIANELKNVKTHHHNKDIILLSHHDPRGGHRGKDFPYMPRLVEYKGMSDSLFGYINDEKIGPVICSKLPRSLMKDSTYLDCMHDGLQEWMRADPEFDCNRSFKISVNDSQKSMRWDDRCDISKFKESDSIKSNEKLHPRYSGYELIHHIVNSIQLETILLGHTHYHNFEHFIGNEPLFSDNILLDSESLDSRINNIILPDASNPLRYISKDSLIKEKQDLENALESMKTSLKNDNDYLVLNLKKAGHTFDSKLKSYSDQNRSLIIMRMTCESDLTDQKINNNPLMGFTLFEVKSREKSNKPQINKVTYYRNGNAVKHSGEELSAAKKKTDSLGYESIGSFEIDREATNEARDSNKQNFLHIINPTLNP